MSKQESSGAIAVIIVAIVLLAFVGIVLVGGGAAAYWLLAPMPSQPPQPQVVAVDPAVSSETVSSVSAIAAAQVGVDVAEIQPSTSLHDLGADELDIVELVMELEEEFDVPIPNEVITDAAGSDDWVAGSDKLTMRRLAEIVEMQESILYGP